MEARKSLLYVTAAGIGVTGSFVRIRLLGMLAARPYPHWYIPWAQVHRHLASQLWWVAAALLPSVLVAVLFGAMFPMAWRRRASTKLVLAAAGAWLAYECCASVIADVQVCIYPVQCFFEPFRLDPVGSVLGVLMPAAMLLSYVPLTRLGNGDRK